VQRRREPAIVRVPERVCPGGHAGEVIVRAVLEEVLEVGRRVAVHEVARDVGNGLMAQPAPGVYAGKGGEEEGWREAEEELHDFGLMREGYRYRYIEEMGYFGIVRISRNNNRIRDASRSLFMIPLALGVSAGAESYRTLSRACSMSPKSMGLFWSVAPAADGTTTRKRTRAPTILQAWADDEADQPINKYTFPRSSTTAVRKTMIMGKRDNKLRADDCCVVGISVGLGAGLLYILSYIVYSIVVILQYIHDIFLFSIYIVQVW
jgi:hypothetical protein